MQAIEDFAASVNTKFNELGTSVDNIVGDVTWLKAEIAKLQNSPGTITPADQALLDGIQARATALGEKTAALDAATETPPAPTP